MTRHTVSPLTLCAIVIFLSASGVAAQGSVHYDTDSAMMSLEKPVDAQNPIEAAWGPGIGPLVIPLYTTTVRSVKNATGGVLTANQAGVNLGIIRLLNASIGSQSSHFSVSCIGDVSFVQPIITPVMPFEGGTQRLVVRALRVGSVYFSSSNISLNTVTGKLSLGELLSSLASTNKGSQAPSVPALRIASVPAKVDCKNLDQVTSDVIKGTLPSLATTLPKATSAPNAKPSSTPSRPSKPSPTPKTPAPRARITPTPTPAPAPANNSELTNGLATVGDRLITIVPNASRTGVAFVFGSGTNVIVAVEVWEATADPSKTRSTSIPVPTSRPYRGIRSPFPYRQPNDPGDGTIWLSFSEIPKLPGCVEMDAYSSGTTIGTPGPFVGGAPQPQATPWQYAYCPGPDQLRGGPPHYRPNKNFSTPWFALFPEAFYLHDPRNLTFALRERRVDLSNLNFDEDASGAVSEIYGSVKLDDAGFSVTRVTK